MIEVLFITLFFSFLEIAFIVSSKVVNRCAVCCSSFINRGSFPLLITRIFDISTC
jgi:hypothetical protein